MSEKVGIILEGGAMRSIFTAGVLDFFLDKKIEIPNVLAVSAGAYAGMNYVSGQRGRCLEAIVEPLRTEKLMGPKLFFKTGEFFNMDAIFDRIPKKDCPFDFESFLASGKRFITSTINCKTGDAMYYDKFESLDEFLKIVRVGNSLPLLAKVGYIDGVPMMDGGMADAIPIEKALEEKWEKIIVVLTRDVNYRKKKKGDIYNRRFVKFLYRKHRGLINAIAGRPARYNHSLDVLTQMESEGKAFIMRPEGINLTNKENDPDVLNHYYKVGYDYAASRYEELLQFLG